MPPSPYGKFHETRWYPVRNKTFCSLLTSHEKAGSALGNAGWFPESPFRCIRAQSRPVWPSKAYDSYNSLTVSRQFFRRQRHSPDVSRLIEFNTAVGGLLWIDIHDPSRSISICQIDMHLDFHVNAERDGGRNQFSEYFWRYERPIEKAEEPFSRCQHCSASLSRGTQ